MTRLGPWEGTFRASVRFHGPRPADPFWGAVWDGARAQAEGTCEEGLDLSWGRRKGVSDLERCLAETDSAAGWSSCEAGAVEVG